MSEPSAGHWQARLTELAKRHKVPGASLGILFRGELTEAATGLANVDAGIEATTETLWQIGSITKVWTATVAMALVDAGVLTLDEPIASVFPGLRLADDGLAKSVTLRHLLSHTSGIDGDVFDDTGRGGDCLEKYVALLDGVAAIHTLGATMSYCNSGFPLLGLIQERLTGLQWDELMRERLFRPLGLTHTVTLPEEALRFRAAAGHFGDPPVVAPQWVLPRSMGPAGLICSTPKDVLTFVRMHLDGGVTADGTRLLSRESAELMRTEQVRLPDPYLLGDAWGLGWILNGWDGRRLFGHGGNTIGQSAFLQVLPDAELAVCLLTNGGDPDALYRDLYREIFADLAGVAMPAPIAPAGHEVPFDPAELTGVYERASVRFTVAYEDDKLIMRTLATGPQAELAEHPETESVLLPAEPGVFATHVEGRKEWVPVVFYSLDDGSRYLHHGGRATPKAG
ncbi:serine hydrolase domain-containing protein [Spongiactinospora rosea]|uniref:serine hydrolase domain-containing protein n=1 Tax=Spongiactinospora rosea TaxID=2248750 RepID=UPI0018F7B765|nr:serine hydrolase domain-containing protein [Spongiactinospora rosea]